MQPWRIFLAAGARKDGLARAICEAHRVAPRTTSRSGRCLRRTCPLAERRRRFGQIFFGTLGIDLADAPARGRQSARNFVFFDAPGVAFFTVDRRLEAGSWFDCALFAQIFMLAARARGIDARAQIALTKYHAIIRRHQPIYDARIIVAACRSATLLRGHASTPVHMPRSTPETPLTARTMDRNPRFAR